MAVPVSQNTPQQCRLPWTEIAEPQWAKSYRGVAGCEEDAHRCSLEVSCSVPRKSRSGPSPWTGNQAIRWANVQRLEHGQARFAVPVVSLVGGRPSRKPPRTEYGSSLGGHQQVQTWLTDKSPTTPNKSTSLQVNRSRREPWVIC